MVVVLVDGWPTDKVEDASRLARESGINIFFVTIEGPDENEKLNVVEANFVDKVLCLTGFRTLPHWVQNYSHKELKLFLTGFRTLPHWV